MNIITISETQNPSISISLQSFHWHVPFIHTHTHTHTHIHIAYISTTWSGVSSSQGRRPLQPAGLQQRHIEQNRNKELNSRTSRRPPPPSKGFVPSKHTPLPHTHTHTHTHIHTRTPPVWFHVGINCITATSWRFNTDI